MKKLLLLFLSIALIPQISLAQNEKLVIDGAIVLSNNDDPNPTSGTIRWNGSNFEGWNGTQWQKLDIEGLTEEVDGSVTNELQALSISGDSIFLSNGGFVVIPKAKHYIGELFEGGIIFYVDEKGEHGLIVSLDDQGNGISWHLGVTEIIGAQSYYDGFTNTNTIVNHLGSGQYAAKLCSDYVSDGFDDWYLPSFWEFQVLNGSTFIINDILDNDGDLNTNGLYDKEPDGLSLIYWTSTEGFSNSAYYIFTNRNVGVYISKSNTYRVRAIRKFGVGTMKLYFPYNSKNLIIKKAPENSECFNSQ